VTYLRQIMIEKLRRRNFAESTYIKMLKKNSSVAETPFPRKALHALFKPSRWILKTSLGLHAHYVRILD
jgi:hypothetical protein